MATPEERKENIDKIRKSLSDIAAIEPKTLARIENLSRDINFSEAVPFLENMIDVFKQLNQRDISRLATPELNKIETTCVTFSKLVQTIKEFNLNINTPADVCTGIISDVKNAYDNIVQPLTIPLAFTATQATDYAQIEREAKGYHANMKEESDKLLKYIEQTRTEAGKALDAVKEQAAEAGVSTNAHIFLKDSQAHSGLAQKWLNATIAIISITCIVASAFVIIAFFYKPASTAEAIQYAISKIILLSTLSFGIFWCAKNYKSQKHNETLNKHRANALMTFRAFVEGSDDTNIKEAMLLQAA